MQDGQAQCLVVGFFKDRGHAHHARSALVSLGVDARADFDPDLETGEPDAARAAYGGGHERNPSVAEAVGDMFRSLFVDFGGRSAHEALYDEARQPAWLVAARCASAQEMESVTQALQQHGGQDLKVLPLAH